MAEAAITLTPAEDEALRAFLSQFHPRDRHRAEGLVAQGRVLNLVRDTRRRQFRATVDYYARYHVLLQADRDHGWLAHCACSSPGTCLHVCALATAVRQFAEPVSPADGEVASPPTPPTAPAAPAAKARARPAPARPLVDAVTAAQGRKPFPAQLNYLNALETLHQRALATEEIRHRDWEALNHGYSLPGEREYDWHQPLMMPFQAKSIIDFVLLLLDGRSVPGFRCPEFLRGPAQSFTPSPALAAFWREREVREWMASLDAGQEALRATEAPPLPAPPERPVRVVLAAGAPELHLQEPGSDDWKKVAASRVEGHLRNYLAGGWTVPAAQARVWNILVHAWQRAQGRTPTPFARYDKVDDTDGVLRLLDRIRAEARESGVFRSAANEPLLWPDDPISWRLDPPAEEGGDYVLESHAPDGSPLGEVLATEAGAPDLVLTRTALWRARPAPARLVHGRPNHIPAVVIESDAGLRLLGALRLPVPEKIRARVKEVPLEVIVRAELLAGSSRGGTTPERLRLEAEARDPKGRVVERLLETGWRQSAYFKPGPGELNQVNRSGLGPVAAHFGTLGVVWDFYASGWVAPLNAEFPGRFAAWVAAMPPDVTLELATELQGLRGDPTRARFSLSATPVGVDWFDLQLQVDAGGEEFTPEELRILLSARGGYARLGGKGWHRIEWDLPPEMERGLARLGLDPQDLEAEPQRVHALQLADEAAAAFLAAEQAEAIRRRAAEVRARVAPEVPAEVQATLRPYQVEGYHFLAYLSENGFGGVLADDMGLGKTVQTLAWIAWLRARTAAPVGPVLVVCPKSVAPNWAAEAERFVPGLRVAAWRGGPAEGLGEVLAAHDLLVVNYAQLRTLAGALAKTDWLAVVADEAQAAKNPDSLTARALRALPAGHRLALTGTPIENRLLDLWSLMAFAMPGALGPRAAFQRRFGQANDGLARQRLAARLRPFLLRRTKAQVAQDLPPRIEEDLRCELEGVQATLYQAEFKRARAMLRKVATPADLDAMRFHFLTSLLRLRQICCHPGLVSDEHRHAPSAKVEALLDLLEPLVEEGHKVLVFSQFVTMLGILRDAIQVRGWKDFLLTGDTEDRGPLVASFNGHEGPAIFLISLKAGGSGLNLASASYVVLFDPWWNPAVEAQAIDRTHRIGQRNTVIAYRLLVKDSIEDKIRELQKQKRLLADDVLGEERFSQSLTVDDLRVLFDGPDES